MKPQRIIVFILNLLIAIRLSISVFAAGSATASVPVTLTVANEYRAVNVTVPVSLPVHIINGKVITADNARITNNSENGSVQVTAVKVTDGAYRVGSRRTLSEGCNERQNEYPDKGMESGTGTDGSLTQTAVPQLFHTERQG